MIENRVHQVENYVKAACEAKVKFILLLSILGTETFTHDNVFTQQFKRMEDLVAESDIPCCFLRCNLYMENLFLQALPIAQNNCVSLPLKEGRWAPVSVQDVAKAACAIMRFAEPHINKAYDLTGPDLITGSDIAHCLSECCGRQLECSDTSLQQYVECLERQGVHSWLARGLADYLDMLEQQANFDSIDSQSFFYDLTGERMTSISDWCQKNSQKLQQQIEKASQFIPKQKTQMQEPSMEAAQQREVSTEEMEPKRVETASAMGGKGIPMEQVSRLRSLLLELISAGSEFSLEEKERIERNEARMHHFLQMEKQLAKLESGQGETTSQEGGGMKIQGMGQEEQGMGQTQQSMGQRGMRETGMESGKSAGTSMGGLQSQREKMKMHGTPVSRSAQEGQQIQPQQSQQSQQHQQQLYSGEWW